jgi:hypothetical protein
MDFVALATWIEKVSFPIELTLSWSIHEHFLDGVPHHEIEVLNIEDMKIKDCFVVFMSNGHIPQNPNSF